MFLHPNNTGGLSLKDFCVSSSTTEMTVLKKQECWRPIFGKPMNGWKRNFWSHISSRPQPRFFYFRNGRWSSRGVVNPDRRAVLSVSGVLPSIRDVRRTLVHRNKTGITRWAEIPKSVHPDHRERSYRPLGCSKRLFSRNHPGARCRVIWGYRFRLRR